MVSGSATSKRQTPRGTLNRDRIVDAATEVLDERGLDAVTMRAVADALQVNPMSLYRHFQDKNALLLAVLDRLLTRIELPPAGLPPAEAARQLMRAYYRLLRRYPGLHLLNPANVPIPGQLRINERLCSILLAHGADDRRATNLLAVFGRFVLGCALCDTEAERLEQDPVYWAEAGTVLATLPRDRFPALRQFAPLLAHPPSADEVFEAGLELLTAPLTGPGGWT
ncbi:TetR/AcrR family transcriptional regulator [Nocardia sp. NPDC088792]|uniref:TetR/AcrR family transcriptional regulator n=1 Tax=Nocardia sp. NPDC088792 TaxID=3364332 RepID=UPI00381BB816